MKKLLTLSLLGLSLLLVSCGRKSEKPAATPGGGGPGQASIEGYWLQTGQKRIVDGRPSDINNIDENSQSFTLMRFEGTNALFSTVSERSGSSSCGSEAQPYSVEGTFAYVHLLQTDECDPLRKKIVFFDGKDRLELESDGNSGTNVITLVYSRIDKARYDRILSTPGLFQ